MKKLFFLLTLFCALAVSANLLKHSVQTSTTLQQTTPRRADTIKQGMVTLVFNKDYQAYEVNPPLKYTSSKGIISKFNFIVGYDSTAQKIVYKRVMATITGIDNDCLREAKLMLPLVTDYTGDGTVNKDFVYLESDRDINCDGFSTYKLNSGQAAAMHASTVKSVIYMKEGATFTFLVEQQAPKYKTYFKDINAAIDKLNKF